MRGCQKETHRHPHHTSSRIPPCHPEPPLTSSRIRFGISHHTFRIPLIIWRCPSAQFKLQTKKNPSTRSLSNLRFDHSNPVPTHRSRSGFPFQFKKSSVRTALAQFSSFPLQSLTQQSLHKKNR